MLIVEGYASASPPHDRPPLPAALDFMRPIKGDTFYYALSSMASAYQPPDFDSSRMGIEVAIAAANFRMGRSLWPGTASFTWQA